MLSRRTVPDRARRTLASHMQPALLLAALLLAYCLAPAVSWADSLSDEQLMAYEDNIEETGLGFNDITPIFKPQYLPAADAALVMEENEIVFLWDAPDSMRILPRSVMVWHEVLDAIIDGERWCATYSPLTGSATAFKGRIGPYETPFGNTGMLLNNNLVLFDYSTNSLWPQILGTAVDGPLKGGSLHAEPLIWTTWGRAMRAYPDAKVLSRSTGLRRPYGKDPYGAYHQPDSYYHNTRIVHPVMALDRRLPPKTVVLGVKQDVLRLAIRADEVRKAGVLNVDLGATPLVALYDVRLDTVRLFDRRLESGDELRFLVENGSILDESTHSEWQGDGRCSYGMMRDSQLTPVPALQVMWFAWYAFYPGTAIYPPLP